MAEALGACLDIPGVRDVRVKGAIGVVELERIVDMNALKARLIAQGIWVRPFRNIVYLTPALTISDADLKTLTDGIVTVLRAGSGVLAAN
jgi:adenosylmethionine-8-amino-7-oxononanoate aminotransferase